MGREDVRLSELGRHLTARGARTVLGSICAPDYLGSGAGIVRAALDARDERCRE